MTLENEDESAESLNTIYYTESLMVDISTLGMFSGLLASATSKVNL